MRELTAFDSFTDLLDAEGYTPSLNMANRRLAEVADVYDSAQASRGDCRRVFRYNNQPLTT